MNNDPIKVFVCYSHADARWLADDDLLPWLQKNLKRFDVEFWWDTEKDHGLRGGDVWRTRIFSHIAEAHLALLLISNDFAASEFICREELPRIQKRLKAQELEVIPILVAPVASMTRKDLSWVFDLQVVPNKAKSLIHCKNDEVQWQETRARLCDEILNRVKLHPEQELQKNTACQKAEAGHEKQRIGWSSSRGLIALAAAGLIIVSITGAILYSSLRGQPTLPKNDVRSLVYFGTPGAATAGSDTPELQCNVFWVQAGHDSFALLRNGDALTSVNDSLFLGIHALSAGYLYVFSIGSSGRVEWLFGQAGRPSVSTNTNPITSGQTVTIPSANNAYLWPDRIPGTESIYVVFCRVRWKDLEDQLAAVAEERAATRLSSGIHLSDRAVLGALPPTNAVIMRAFNNKRISVEIGAQPVCATNSHLVIEFWFTHQ